MMPFLGFCALLLLVWLLSSQMVPRLTTARIVAKCWPCETDYTSDAFEALAENKIMPFHYVKGAGVVEARKCASCGEVVGRKVVQ